MGMYSVDISPLAHEVFERYMELCLKDSGDECALRLLESFDEKVGILEDQPLIGCARLRYIPDKYRMINFWPHLWLVFQIYEKDKSVKLEYIIDDRQDYGRFIK